MNKPTYSEILKKVRAWAKRHRGIINLVGCMFALVVSLVFWFAAASILYPLPGFIGPEIMAGIVLLMFAGYFFKMSIPGPTFEDETWDRLEGIEKVIRSIAMYEASNRAYISELRNEGDYIETVEEERASFTHRINKVFGEDYDA